MNIIFLDIDGVLNNYNYAEQKYKEMRENAGKEGLGVINNCYDYFDPVSVVALNTILQKTDAKIVISSAWRIYNTKDELRDHFKKQGILDRIISMTPIDCGDSRGSEIDEWLQKNGKFVKNFVIIDDRDDMEPHMDKFVQTEFETGLRKEHIEDILRILGD